ncbi:hypothetical protein BaRGS_00027016 [Batillaria attramentaria]|uniref:Ig-like domain-containing protein n=1 Tax=Batillaria attramentaria TaxID=370345 RepID=A0ABD0K4G1_9CAEN
MDLKNVSTCNVGAGGERECVVGFLVLLTSSSVSGMTEGQVPYGNKTFCETSPTVLHEKLTITCHFTEDVRTTRRNVTLRRKDFGDLWTEDSDLLIECFWPENAENVTCNEQKRFYVAGAANNTLTVARDHFQMNLVGEYACRLVGTEAPVDTCNVTMAEVTIRPLRRKVVGVMTGCLLLIVLVVTVGGCAWAR